MNKNTHSRPVTADILYDKLKWLTAQEAAEYLRTSPGQIRNMVWQGKLRSYKLGTCQFGQVRDFERTQRLQRFYHSCADGNCLVRAGMLKAYKHEADRRGIGYQTLMLEVLQNHVGAVDLEKLIDERIQKALKRA